MAGGGGWVLPLYNYYLLFFLLKLTDKLGKSFDSSTVGAIWVGRRQKIIFLFGKKTSIDEE